MNRIEYNHLRFGNGQTIESDNGTNTTSTPTNYLQYSNSDLDMRIKYPDNWVYTEYIPFIPNDDIHAKFIPSSEVSFLDNLTASTDVKVIIGKQVDLPYDNMPLDLYFDYVKKLQTNGGFNITNTGKTNMSDGNPAYELVSSNKDIPVKSVTVIMNKFPESYFFIYEATPEKFNTYLPIAQEMYKTLFIN